MKKLRYVLDDFVSRGFAAQLLLLAGTALLLTLLFGVITWKMGEPDYGEAYWTSLMHMIDQGTITGDQAGTDGYFIFMLLVTFTGMAFTSTIIALISTAFQGRLDELKKGHSAVIEKDHVVILGFDENAYTICREIMEGSLVNRERVCLVAADSCPKEEMEHAAKEFRGGTRPCFEKSSRLPDSGRETRIIFRSGDLSSENTLSICAAEKARTVVINRENDAETIRILLVLAEYLKKKHAWLDDEKMPSVVALIHDRRNLSAAKAAAGISFRKGASGKKKNEYRVRILYDKEIIGELLSQASVSPGLPFVMDGLFNYIGSSVRIETGTAPDAGSGEGPFAGKTLREIAESAAEEIPLGFFRQETERSAGILLDPPDRYCAKPGDRLICLSEQPGLHLNGKVRPGAVGVRAASPEGSDLAVRNFLFIGQSEVLSEMLKNIGRYCAEGSGLSLICGEDCGAAAAAPSAGLSVQPENDPENSRRNGAEKQSLCPERILCEEPCRWESVNRILEEHAFWFDPADERHLTNIVLLSQGGADKMQADEQIMVLLLNIRQYLKDRGITDVSITSEMLLPQNQLLLQNNSCNDFVVASEITNRMIAQIAEDPEKYYIMEDLLKKRSGRIRLYPLSDYADTEQDFNFAFVFREAEERGRRTGETVIPLGWIRLGREEAAPDSETGENARLVLNPEAGELAEIHHGGCAGLRLIVLAGGSSQTVCT